MLSSICKDISSGRPLWGLIRANEHLLRSHPLHAALCARAKQAIGEADLKRLNALKIVASGVRLNELDQLTSAAVTGEPTSENDPIPELTVTANTHSRSINRRATMRSRIVHQRRAFTPSTLARPIPHANRR